MADYWFTEEERASLCLNSHCSEHGSGDEECDIATSSDEFSQRKARSEYVGQMNASVLSPEVEVR